MRRKALALFVLTLVGCARREAGAPAAQTSPSPSPKPFEVDTKTPLKDPLPMVAAKVNGREIPTAQVVVVAEALLERGAVKEKIAAYRETLNQLVVRELLLGEAVRRGIAADSAAVDRAYNEARVAYKEDADWREALRKQGFTPEGFREELRAKQTVSLLLGQEVEQVAEITDAEAREFYEKNAKELAVERLKVAHVLFRVTSQSTREQRAAARARAAAVRVRALEGANFEGLVTQFSEDQTTKTRGGVIEPFGPGEIMKPIEVAAFALKIGEISEVVETQYGYHVLKLLEKIPGETPPFEQLAERVKQALAQERRQVRVQALVERLRAGARIEIFL